MFERIEAILATRPGKFVAITLAVALVWLAAYQFKANLGISSAAAASRQRIFVCAETGKSFEVELKPGMTFPVKSPYTGRETGYEFNEVCTWTADGHVAETPTYVLLNRTVNKKGATFCPTCGRLVIENNPPAKEGVKPPPTRAEYSGGKQ